MFIFKPEMNFFRNILQYIFVYLFHCFFFSFFFPFSEQVEDYGIREHRWPECAAALCDCDRIAAECFAANAGTFNDDYVRYDRDFCEFVSPRGELAADP